MAKVKLIEDTVTGFVQVPYGDTKHAKKGRVHYVTLDRVPELHERLQTKVKDDDQISTATFVVSSPLMHLDPSVRVNEGESDVVAQCQVHRITREW